MTYIILLQYPTLNTVDMIELFPRVLILYTPCADILQTSITNDCNYKARAWLSILHRNPDMDHMHVMVFVNNSSGGLHSLSRILNINSHLKCY